MSDTSDSVYAEGNPVVTSPTSPYDKFREEMTKVVPVDGSTVSEHQKLRVECVKLAILADTTGDQEHIVNIMKRYWQFIQSGD